MIVRLATAAAAVVILGACASPEATRVRGGGAGADVGNRTADVQMHEGSVIYANTPCLTTLPECTGPLPLGTARPD
jgi:hypothetical protein